MVVAEPVTVIQATLSPIFLVSGVSIFLNFIQARLFRVVDRLRALRKVLQGLPPENEDAVQSVTGLQDVLLARARVLRNAVIFGVVTLGATAITAVFLVAPIILGFRVPGIATVSVFATGLIAFVVSIGFGMADTVTSVRVVAREIAADRYVGG